MPFTVPLLVFILHLIETGPTWDLLIHVYFLGPALQYRPDHLPRQV